MDNRIMIGILLGIVLIIGFVALTGLLENAHVQDTIGAGVSVNELTQNVANKAVEQELEKHLILEK